MGDDHVREGEDARNPRWGRVSPGNGYGPFGFVPETSTRTYLVVIMNNSSCAFPIRCSSSNDIGMVRYWPRPLYRKYIQGTAAVSTGTAPKHPAPSQTSDAPPTAHPQDRRHARDDQARILEYCSYQLSSPRQKQNEAMTVKIMSVNNANQSANGAYIPGHSGLTVEVRRH